MVKQFNNRFGHYTLLLAVGLFMFVGNLGGPQLWDVDEGRNCTCSYEMMKSGNWIIPTFNGELRVHKPALLYWLHVGCFQLFGVNEFAARFPSALAALLTVLLAYELARSMFDSGTGLLSGLIVATCVMQCMAARFANQDALINLFTVLTFFLFWRRFSKDGGYPFFACGLASGLAVMAKGLVGLVLPAAVIFLFLFWSGRWRILLDRKWGLAVLAFSVVALPWYILVCVETKGDYVRGFFLTHHVGRFTGAMEEHGGGPWYYPVILLGGLAPWSMFIGLTLWYGFWSAIGKPWHRFQTSWQSAHDQEGTDNQSDSPENRYRFLWCWIGLYLLFFTLAATKLPNYILPITTPLAILTARLLIRWQRQAIHPPRWVMHIGLVCLSLIGVGASVTFLVLGEVIPSSSPLTVPVLRYWAAIGLVPIIAAGLCWYALFNNRRHQFVAVLSCCALLFLGPILVWSLEIINRKKAPAGLVAQSGADRTDQDMRIVMHKMNDLPSLNFYSKRSTINYPQEARVKEIFQQSVPVYLFVPEPHWKELQPHMPGPYQLVASHPDMFRGWNILVIRNMK